MKAQGIFLGLIKYSGLLSSQIHSEGEQTESKHFKGAASDHSLQWEKFLKQSIMQTRCWSLPTSSLSDGSGARWIYTCESGSYPVVESSSFWSQCLLHQVHVHSFQTPGKCMPNYKGHCIQRCPSYVWVPTLVIIHQIFLLAKYILPSKSHFYNR